MIGDRMDTDVVAGLNPGLHTILVLTGAGTRESAERHPYRPSRIVGSVAELAGSVAAWAGWPPARPARRGRRARAAERPLPPDRSKRAACSGSGPAGAS